MGDDRMDPMARQPTEPTLGDVILVRLGRREFMRGTVAVAALAGIGQWACQTSGGGAVAAAATPEAPTRPETEAALPAHMRFAGVAHGVDEHHHVAAGYDADILIRWGDPVLADAPAFNPLRPDAAAQEKQFGYNNDFIGFIALPPGVSGSPRRPSKRAAAKGTEAEAEDKGSATPRALLVVNHEYTIAALMFPGREHLPVDPKDPNTRLQTKALVDVEMAAHGGSIVEIMQQGGRWRLAPPGRFNRRITASKTRFKLSGPAAGSPRLRTRDDPKADVVIGTFNNCAGGVTPWGTYLMSEENFFGYFSGELAASSTEASNHKRYSVPGGEFQWGRHYRRFDIGQEPNEPNRYGWICEIDPLDPSWVPRKRTALGRFFHEGAECLLNPDGRAVIYSGDDARGEYLYKFVTRGRFEPDQRAANRQLLDDGDLYVAQFDAGGTVTWLKLAHGNGPLTAANGFASQADVVVEARRAADLLRATPMDRPEDVEADPATGKVYVMLTNNSARTADKVDAANPRPSNLFGHILELDTGGDHAAEQARWNILVRCGDPRKPEVGALWHPDTGDSQWFGSPDNCTVAPGGGLWVATDQGDKWNLTGTSDGLWALGTDGEARGLAKMLFRAPLGAEICGPRFAPDGKTLFTSVQHPGADGARNYAPFGRDSTFEDPATRWPDFNPRVPPRPSVVAIRHQRDEPIGSA